MPTQPLPEPDDVRAVLNGLLGRDITVTRETAESIALDAKYIVGMYQREDGKVGGLAVVDLELAAYAGAALALIPKGMAEESIAEGSIEEMLLENFQEVLNVGARWFTGKASPRVSLTETFPTNAKLPDDVRLVMAAPNERLDVVADVAGYGKGRLRLLAMDF